MFISKINKNKNFDYVNRVLYDLNLKLFGYLKSQIYNLIKSLHQICSQIHRGFQMMRVSVNMSLEKNLISNKVAHTHSLHTTSGHSVS